MTASIQAVIGGVDFSLRADTEALERVEDALQMSFVLAFAKLGASMRIADVKKVFAAVSNTAPEVVNEALSNPGEYLKAVQALQRAVQAAMPEAFGEGETKGAGTEAAENPQSQ